MKASLKSFLTDLLAIVLGIFITFGIQGMIDKSQDRKSIRSSLELVRSELEKNIEDVALIRDYLYEEIKSAEYLIDHKDSIGYCPADSLSYHTGIVFAEVSLSLSQDAMELLKMSSIFQKMGDNDLSMKIIRAYDTCGAIVEYMNRHVSARDARFEKSIDKETAGLYTREGGLDIKDYLKTDYGCYSIEWLTSQPDPMSFTDVSDLEDAISAIDAYLD